MKPVFQADDGTIFQTAIEAARHDENEQIKEEALAEFKDLANKLVIIMKTHDLYEDKSFRYNLIEFADSGFNGNEDECYSSSYDC